jgi:tetratricopeptide (TPR) repeat protein
MRYIPGMKNTPFVAALVVCGLLLPRLSHALSEQTNTDADTLLAEMALSKGDCRSAAERYLRIATKRKDAALATRATSVGSSCHHLDVELRAARRWRELEPQNPDAAQAVALAALKLDRINDAQAAFAGVHAAKGDAGVVEIMESAVEAGGAWGAFASLRALFDRKGASADLLLAASDLALDAFDFQAARGYAERAVDDDPASGDARARLAAALSSLGEAVPALAVAREAAALSPERARFAVVDALSRLDRVDEARRELEGMTSDSGSQSEAELRLARLALQNGQLEEAQKRFLGLLGAGAVAPEAFYFLSIIAERQNNKEGALEGYQRLVSAGAGLPARVRAGKLLLEKGDRDAAFRLLDALAEKDRDRALDVELAKAALLEEAGKPAEALVLLDAAEQRFANHPSVRYQRALALDKASRSRESIRALEKLLADRPDDPSILNALGYSLADDNLQLDRAEKLIQAALRATPDNPAYLDSLGWVKFRRGDAVGALPLLERAYRTFPDSEIAAHLGETMWVLNRRSEALALWTRAYSRNPESEILRATVQRLTGAPPAKPTTESPSI